MLMLIAGDIKTPLSPLAMIFNLQIKSEGSHGICLYPGLTLYHRVVLDMVIPLILWFWLTLVWFLRSLCCSSLNYFPCFPYRDLQFSSAGWQLFLFSFTSLTSSLVKLLGCRHIYETDKWVIEHAGGVYPLDASHYLNLLRRRRMLRSQMDRLSLFIDLYCLSSSMANLSHEKRSIRTFES